MHLFAHRQSIAIGLHRIRYEPNANAFDSNVQGRGRVETTVSVDVWRLWRWPLRRRGTDIELSPI
eukprot:11369172-Alexandrium_andersonii.AAC.1